MKLSALILVVGAIGTFSSAAATITFDEFGPQPSLFADTVALSNEYAGLTFSGPGPLDGGAILDVTSTFGINPRSGANFLAFNSSSTLSNGGTPTDPQSIGFDGPVSSVSLWAGNGVAHNFRLEAFDSSNNLIDTGLGSNAPGNYVELSVFGNISRVVLTNLSASFDDEWVVDDLSFERTQSVPEGSWSFALLGLVGLFGVRRRKSQA